MSDDDQRLIHVLLNARQQLHHLVSALRIQVSGGFIGKNDIRSGDQRPGDSNSLLLPSGQLSGQMIQAAGDAQQSRDSVQIGLVGTPAVQKQRHHNILSGGQHGKQIELLKDKTDISPPKCR